jgi:hypothetical protein
VGFYLGLGVQKEKQMTCFSRWGGEMGGVRIHKYTRRSNEIQVFK